MKYPSAVRCGTKGLTLVEVAVSVFISGVVSAGIVFPLTATALLQRQEAPLAEAQNLARLEMENIRASWSTSAGWGSNTSATIPIDTTAWAGVTTTSISLSNISGNLTNDAATIAPGSVSSSTTAGNLNGYTNVRGASISIPKGTNYAKAYTAQIMVGETPNVTNDRSRRVVIRIYATNSSGTIAAGGTQTSVVKSRITADGGTTNTALQSGPLALLITDIAKP